VKNALFLNEQRMFGVCDINAKKIKEKWITNVIEK
jgi:hypothetical protein